MFLQSKIVCHHLEIIISSITSRIMEQPSRISSSEMVSGGVIRMAQPSNSNQNKINPLS
jgi:hypothetical protein